MKAIQVAALWLVVGAAGAAGGAPVDRPFQVTGKSYDESLAKWLAKIDSYVQQARATYPDAKRRYLRGLPPRHRFFVTYMLRDRSGPWEQVFVRVDGIDAGIIAGRIDSDLATVREFRQGDSIKVSEREILDWLIVKADGSEEGNLVGKFVDTLQQPPAAPPPPATPPLGPPPAVDRVARPIPEALRAEVERASRLGGTIYLYYRAATIGADALLQDARPHNDVPLGGALAVMDPSSAGQPMSFTVAFFTRGDEPLVAYRVRISFTAGAAAIIEDVRPPARPSPEEKVLYRARQTALAALGQRRQLIDAVVLPPRVAGGQDILVYLIAGTKQREVAVLGQHHRVLVSPNGAQVLRLDPLSKGTIEMPITGGGGMPAGARAVALVTSHLVTDSPLETHVFASLRYGLPIDVVTRVGSWHIDREKIEYLGR